jgi:hypothetical protein
VQQTHVLSPKSDAQDPPLPPVKNLRRGGRGGEEKIKKNGVLPRSAVNNKLKLLLCVFLISRRREEVTNKNQKTPAASFVVYEL